jgi:hypothetical protein
MFVVVFLTEGVDHAADGAASVKQRRRTFDDFQPLDA